MTQDRETLKIKDYSEMSENKTPYIKTQNLDKALIKENLTVRAFTRNGEKWEIYEQRSQFNTVERAVVQTHSKEHQARGCGVSPRARLWGRILLSPSWSSGGISPLCASGLSSANQGSHRFVKGLSEIMWIKFLGEYPTRGQHQINTNISLF